LARLDREIVRILNQRARLVKKLAKRGDDLVSETHDYGGAIQFAGRLLEKNPGPLSDETFRAVFREILSGCRQLVIPLRVAYLGPPFSYSHLAAVKRFGEGAELAPVGTIAAVFEELNRGQAHFGIVPIENSTDGRVVDTLDVFARMPARICGEVRLRIHHNLLGRCSRSEVAEVYSKPQALSQCRGWLAKHLPAARTVEMTSTAAAAQLAAEKTGAAAIASKQAAANYGIGIIAENIEDNVNNVTRFAVIGNDSAKKTGDDKTALKFEVSHRPGALADVMTVFKRSNLNLTWIESFPMPGSNNEYLFFVEFEGHQDDASVQRALTSLAKKTIRLDVLGSYAKSALVE
jgi:chorismate mutase/prephenate dehydratase